VRRLTYEIVAGTAVTVYTPRDGIIPWSVHVAGHGWDNGEYKPVTPLALNSLGQALQTVLTLIDQAVQTQGERNPLGLDDTLDSLAHKGSEIHEAWESLLR
jgi:hypothetical protein